MDTVSTNSGTGSQKSGAIKEQIKVVMPKDAQRKVRARVADSFNGQMNPRPVKFNNQHNIRNVGKVFEARLSIPSKGCASLTIVSECGTFQSYAFLGNRHGEPMKDIDLCNLVKDYLGSPLELKRKHQSKDTDYGDRGNN